MVPLQETNVTEDEDAELTCELSKPDALVKWLKNGVELSANEHVSFDSVGTKRTMKINKSVRDDASNYQCQIFSSGATTQAELTVTGSPKYIIATHECGVVMSSVCLCVCLYVCLSVLFVLLCLKALI